MTIPRERGEFAEVSTIQHYPLGTVYRLDRESHRYARAGEKLTAGEQVYASQVESLVPYLVSECTGREVVDAGKLNERIWGDVRSMGQGVALGRALSDVPEGYYCWVREARARRTHNR